MSTIIKPELSTEFANCVALYKSGSFVECLDKIAKLQDAYPDNIDVTYVRALCFMALERFDEAKFLLEKCAEIIKHSDELFSNMALLYEKIGDVGKAIDSYKNALALNPNNPASINNLGNIYNNIGQNKLALECFNRLVEIGHNEYYVYNNIALVYKKLGLLPQAAEAIEKSLRFNPQNYQPYHNAALICAAMGNKQNAIACYEVALRFAPGNAQIISEYRDLCVNVCDWKKYEELDKHFNELVKSGVNGGTVSPMSNIQKNINLQENLDCALQYTAEQVRGILQANQPFKHNVESRRSRRKIKLGYLSSDIKDHPVAHLMRGVFKNHNKDEFEVFLYSSSEDNPNDTSGYREAIKESCEHFIDIRNDSNIEVASKIYEDGIDVLIDLNGHTGLSRLEALALKPAPIQINYIGYIGSMGADFIDYIITDKIVTPTEHQEFYTEKFLYMPNCYQANDDSLAISGMEMTRADFGLPEDGFVFCSFNQTYKIEPVLFKAWMNILKRVPGSVLWLYKGSIYINDNLAKENLFKHAAEAGVDPKRLIFADGMMIDKHLKRVGLADLALDTRIYNGGTVTSHTLWAGVPVVTLMGGHFASRMASSIVSSVGMPELITHTPEEYEEFAVKIATTEGAAAALKDKLAENIATKPLFNTKQFTKDIESLYKQAFQGFVEGKKA